MRSQVNVQGIGPRVTEADDFIAETGELVTEGLEDLGAFFGDQVTLRAERSVGCWRSVGSSPVSFQQAFCQ